MILLDTDICIAFAKGDTKVRDQLRRLSAGDVAVCSIVKAELLYGARHSARPADNLRTISGLIGGLRSLPFDDDATEHYGIIRAELRRAGTPIGGNDLLIAAIALANEATVATRNIREFERVPGLHVVAW